MTPKKKKRNMAMRVASVPKKMIFIDMSLSVRTSVVSDLENALLVRRAALAMMFLLFQMPRSPAMAIPPIP